MFLPKYDPAYDPIEDLDRQGIRLVRHTLNGHNAVWIRERRMVIVDRALRHDLLRPTLTHECDHVFHDDVGGHDKRNEARANLHSALILVDPAEWDVLTRTHCDYDRICLELGITRRQFIAYLDHRRRIDAATSGLVRIGGATYTHPRMGAGQWQQKVMAS